MLRALFVAAFVVSVVLGGAACRVKNPPTPVAIQEDGMSHVAVPSAWGGKPGAPSSPDQNWILTFNDNQLNVLVAEALAYNPDLNVAAARVEEARAGAAGRIKTRRRVRRASAGSL